MISCRAFFIRFSEEGQYEHRNTSTGSVMLANLRSNVISFLVLRTLDWDGGNGFVGRGRCKDCGAIAPQVSVSKNPDFKTNTGVL